MTESFCCFWKCCNSQHHEWVFLLLQEMQQPTIMSESFCCFQKCNRTSGCGFYVMFCLNFGQTVTYLSTPTVIYIHCQDLMKSWSIIDGNSSLLFVMKVMMAWHFVSNLSHNVVTVTTHHLTLPSNQCCGDFSAISHWFTLVVAIFTSEGIMHMGFERFFALVVTLRRLWLEEQSLSSYYVWKQVNRFSYLMGCVIRGLRITKHSQSVCLAPSKPTLQEGLVFHTALVLLKCNESWVLPLAEMGSYPSGRSFSILLATFGFELICCVTLAQRL
jgi:hypothetical protein